MLQLVAFWHRDNREIAKASMAYQRFGDLGNLAVLDQGLLEYPRLFGAVFEGCKQAFGILPASLLFASGEGRSFRERFVERTPGHLKFDLECDRRDFRTNGLGKGNGFVNSRDRGGLTVRGDREQQILEGHWGISIRGRR